MPAGRSNHAAYQRNWPLEWQDQLYTIKTIAVETLLLKIFLISLKHWKLTNVGVNGEGAPSDSRAVLDANMSNALRNAAASIPQDVSSQLLHCYTHQFLQRDERLMNAIIRGAALFLWMIPLVSELRHTLAH